jgi:hypothetical protein
VSQGVLVASTVARRWPLTAVLAGSLAHAAAPLSDGRETPAPPSPLRDAAERIVRDLEEDGRTPCRKVSEGVPCFPVTSEEARPKWRVSVRESLGDLGPEGKQSPSRPPTPDEMGALRRGPMGQAYPQVALDPVCVGKSVVRRLKGRNDTYYLYRLRDVHGERVALYAHRVEAATFQGAVEFLGRFDGECQALTAYRREVRGARPPEEPPAR